MEVLSPSELCDSTSFFVYILQSDRTSGYYVGQSKDVQLRLIQHNSNDNVHFTHRDRPWVLKATLVCTTRTQALKVESFIKKQKSRVFIEKIISSQDVRESLANKFL